MYTMKIFIKIKRLQKKIDDRSLTIFSKNLKGYKGKNY